MLEQFKKLLHLSQLGRILLFSMTQSYVSKRKPGRPPKEQSTPTSPVQKGQIQQAASESVVVPLPMEPIHSSLPIQSGHRQTLQERALWYLPVEAENPLYSVDDNLLPAYIYKECGSVSMYQYFQEKDVPTLHSFVRWLTNTKQLHFDKPPVPGDILFLQNNGTIIAARLVISIEEHLNPPENYDKIPVWQRKNLDRVRAGMKKTYTVTLHDWAEPVHVWYAIGKVTA